MLTQSLGGQCIKMQQKDRLITLEYSISFKMHMYPKSECLSREAKNGKIQWPICKWAFQLSPKHANCRRKTWEAFLKEFSNLAKVAGNEKWITFSHRCSWNPFLPLLGFPVLSGAAIGTDWTPQMHLFTVRTSSRGFWAKSAPRYSFLSIINPSPVKLFSLFCAEFYTNPSSKDYT